MRLADVPIRVKLSLTIAVSLLTFIGVVWFYTFILSECLANNQTLLQREIRLQSLGQEMNIHLLTARRAEKDYLNRLDPAQPEQLRAAVGELLHRNTELLALARQSERENLVARATTIEEGMQRYLEAFKRVVEAQEEIGLTPETGHQGRFRQAAHDLEDMLAPLRWEGIHGEVAELLMLEIAWVLEGGENFLDQLPALTTALRESLQADEGLRSRFAGVITLLGDSRRAEAWRRLPAANRKSILQQPLHKELNRLRMELDSYSVSRGLLLYLELRRTEKNYLLRGEAEYLQKATELLQELGRQVAKAQIPEEVRNRMSAALDTYRVAFLALVQKRTNLLEQVENMRLASHQVEPLTREISALSSTLARDTARKTKEYGERWAGILMLFSFCSILLTGLVLSTIISSVTRSLNRLWRYSKDVATGRFDAVPVATGGDEIGHLAE
ncbi:MAG: hypothetical protein HQL56_16755, partial [Magnetococcales bacterium]|nr:hypothetical protein [Magnetococcales bacterium]